jgi:iron complex transport system ATP-binding protein
LESSRCSRRFDISAVAELLLTGVCFMTSPILEFRNVSFARGSRVLLDRLSFGIEAQDMVALIGPNGIGKTTLLRLACRLLRPSHGEVLLDGKRIEQWSRRELPRSIALIPQGLEVPFNFRVEEIVAQGRVPYANFFGAGTYRDDKAVQSAMEAVDIKRLRHRIYSELSGGERQRVKIAIGLAQQAKVMLLDEPTQHLDIGRQIELVGLLRELNGQGITILAALHDLNLVAENFCSAILLTPEPSWVAGPVEKIVQASLLERAFCAPPESLAQYCMSTSASSRAELVPMS